MKAMLVILLALLPLTSQADNKWSDNVTEVIAMCAVNAMENGDGNDRLMDELYENCLLLSGVTI